MPSSAATYVLSFIPRRLGGGRTVVGLNKCSWKAFLASCRWKLTKCFDTLLSTTMWFTLLCRLAQYNHHMVYLTLHCFQPEARELSSSVGSLLGVNSVGEFPHYHNTNKRNVQF